MVFSKINTIVVSVLLICFGCANAEYGFVDPNIVLKERFEGWGTSLAWWADMVGGMEQEIADHVVDALFSPSKLNLNIARYVIGGTTPDNYTCGEYRDGAATESFKDGPDSPFNWDRDPRQRKILGMAKAAGANIFEAFSNTPPQWMTISGCSKGTNFPPPLFQNFDPANSDIFSDYATEVIKYFHENWNISFSTYSPFNEPFGLHGIGGWIGPSQSQEGCNMARPTMVSVIKSVHQALTEKNLTFVKIAVSDETQINTQIQSYNSFVEAGVSELFQQVNVHGYWDDSAEVNRRDVLSSKCDRQGHDLWMDEMGWAGTPTDNMEQGLNIANRIVKDFKGMIPSAWVYWQAVEDIGAWGLIDVPFHKENRTLEDVRYNSGYYALEQFSQHIRQGYKLIHVSNRNTVGAMSEDLRKLVLVTVNPEATTVTESFDLGLFDSLGAVTLSRTSASEQHVDLPPPTVTSENRVELECPPQSISTLEFSSVAFGGGDVTNLLQNGNFESVTEAENGAVLPTAWTLEHGRDDAVNGVTDDNPWRGEYSGMLELGPLKSFSLVQNITLEPIGSNSSCTYYLNAWCSSTRLGSQLNMMLYLDEYWVVGFVDIDNDGLFSSYSLSLNTDPFEATGNVTVQVTFGSGGAQLAGTAKIDDVQLHRKCVI